jgi:hypothetical protein
MVCSDPLRATLPRAHRLSIPRLVCMSISSLVLARAVSLASGFEGVPRQVQQNKVVWVPSCCLGGPISISFPFAQPASRGFWGLWCVLRWTSFAKTERVSSWISHSERGLVLFPVHQNGNGGIVLSLAKWETFSCYPETGRMDQISTTEAAVYTDL